MPTIETKKCNIFYTLNNKKPDPFQKYGERYTYKYKLPFTLAPGNVTIKAIAITRDGTKQSLAVTKVFVVYEGEEMYSLENNTKEVGMGRTKGTKHVQSLQQLSICTHVCAYIS